jgi:hypothetical protein
MSLPQIFRSESIFHPNGDPRNDHDDNQSSHFNFNENYCIAEEAASAQEASAQEEAALAEEETAALETQKLFILNKQDEYDDYTQVTQITVEAIKSTWTHSGFAVINIHKSEKANECYVYMPITGNIYILLQLTLHLPSRTCLIISCSTVRNFMISEKRTLPSNLFLTAHFKYLIKRCKLQQRISCVCLLVKCLFHRPL